MDREGQTELEYHLGHSNYSLLQCDVLSKTVTVGCLVQGHNETDGEFSSPHPQCGRYLQTHYIRSV